MEGGIPDDVDGTRLECGVGMRTERGWNDDELSLNLNSFCCLLGGGGGYKFWQEGYNLV